VHGRTASAVFDANDPSFFDREQSDYEGGLGNPLSWEREVEKFNWLSEPFADAALRNDIIAFEQPRWSGERGHDHLACKHDEILPQKLMQLKRCRCGAALGDHRFVDLVASGF
jgi:hypothetical protein